VSSSLVGVFLLIVVFVVVVLGSVVVVVVVVEHCDSIKVNILVFDCIEEKIDDEKVRLECIQVDVFEYVVRVEYGIELDL
jgi:hypothetical protein